MFKARVKYFMGFFAAAGILAFGSQGIDLGSTGIFEKGGYTVYAEFDDVGGLEAGDPVTIAGIKVGRVGSVALKDYVAVVVMSLDKDVGIQNDSVASIRTKGVMGGKYVQITPGGSDRMVRDGGVIRETESAMDPESIISSYICGKI